MFKDFPLKHGVAFRTSLFDSTQSSGNLGTCAAPPHSSAAEMTTSAGPWPSQNFGYVLMVRFSTGLAHTSGTAGAAHVLVRNWF